MKLSFTEPRGSMRQRARYLMQNRTFRLIMRVSYINIFFLAFSLKLFAFESNAQSMEETYITLELHNAPLKKVFEEIERQTEFIFVFSPEKLNGYPNVNFPKGRYVVKGIVENVLRGTDLWYQQKNKYIVISLPDEKPGEPNETSENTTDVSTAQEFAFTVTGKVTDKDGIGMSAVNIIVKGTVNGTATDANGDYAIDVNENDFLVFSFIGHKTITMSVGNRTIIDVMLEEDVATLNEVVVSGGYYQTTDKLKTGNITKITAEDIERQPVTSPLLALQGRVPGLDITPLNGVAGGAVQVEIRGRNSIRPEPGYPLYVVDGIPIDSRAMESNNSNLLGGNGFDPLSSINPANIESIEVLKDADATSIYGSRGANGVILIKTKRGSQSEKTTVDIQVYSGAGKIPNFLTLLNSQQYLEMRQEAFANAAQVPTAGNAPDLLRWDTTRYTDWQDVLLGNSAKVTDVQLNLSGGNANTSFRFGGSYHKEGMVFPGNFGYERITGNFNLNHTSHSQKFRATLSANYGVDLNNLFTEDDLVTIALSLPPVAPELYQDDGELNWQNSTWINPLASLRKTDDSKGDNLIFNSNLGYELLPGLEMKVSMGYNLTSRASIVKYPFTSYNPATTGSGFTGSSDFGNSKRSSWIVEPQAVYQKKFSDHSLNLIVGATWQEGQSSYQLVQARGYTSDALLGSLRGATSTDYVIDGNSEYRYMALFARIGYNWKEKYIVNLTGRRDGSSRFGPNNRFANFGALGVAWVFSNENFLKENTSLLNFGKLRFSYGSTGNDQIGDYRYLSTYGFTTNNYQNGVSLVPTALYNPDYAWEETKKMEAALELRFFQDRISISSSWYRNRSSNQLLSYPLPGATGFTSVLSNLDATVENSGWEFVLSTVNIDNDKLRWTSSFNISLPQNKLISFPGIEQTAYANTYLVGESMYIRKVYHSKGVNPQTGLYEVEDVNNDGLINIEDRVFIQNTARTYYGGLSNSIQYRGLELSFLFQFSNYTRDVAVSLIGLRGNHPVDVLDRWQKEGDVAAYQKFSSRSTPISASNSNQRQSDGAFKNSSFIRLKTLSLSYQLSSALTEKIKIKGCKFFIQGQNLFTSASSDNLMLDPETGTSLPPLRMLTGGIEIKL